MEKLKSYKRQILKWTCIGLLIRLILMPFTMHSQDLFFINYFPMMFAKEGIWDPYGFISTSLPHYPATYYSPVTFIIMSITNFIFIKLFNAVSLVKTLEISSTMMFSRFGPIDFVYAFSESGLFKNLFLMKSPYLIFDFLIGAILLKLALSKKLALASYKLWMLNIVVLHTAYMIGQLDLIPAFFVIIALFFAIQKRPYLSIVSLTLGGATKLFPYVLILPTSLLLGHNWKKRLSLLCTAGVLSILIYLPFYLSSGDSIFGTFWFLSRAQFSGIAKWILPGVFLAFYSLIAINAMKDSGEADPERKLLFYFLAVGFLTYIVLPVRFRYLVYVTPLLVLVLPQNKKFSIFTLFIILMVAFSSLHTRYLQWGLFAPLNPEYFVNLPTVQEIVGRFINIEIVYKIMVRALVLCFLIAGWWIWCKRSSYEPERLPANGEKKFV